MLKHRGLAVGLHGVHAHRWRHNFAQGGKRAVALARRGSLWLLASIAELKAPTLRIVSEQDKSSA